MKPNMDKLINETEAPIKHPRVVTWKLICTIIPITNGKSILTKGATFQIGTIHQVNPGKPGMLPL